ncbi:MAG: serine hydrolase domain-containing protein, partial [Acidimicrobiales bacterium]
LSSSHIFNQYCSAKPIVACMFLAEAEAAGLRLDDRVADLLHNLTHFDSLTWAQVLNHSAGLNNPSSLEAHFLSSEEARDRALTQIPSGLSSYSECGGMYIIIAAIEFLKGRRFSEITKERLRSAGLADAIFLNVDSYRLREPMKHIGYSIRGLPQRAIPAYQDAAPHFGGVKRPALRVFASSSGLVRFYGRVGKILAGENVDGFPSTSYLSAALGRNRGPEFDETLRRTCDFAGGFMTSLTAHNFGVTIGSSAVGHSGLLGNSFGFVDPKTGYAYSAVLNGAAGNADDIEILRPRLVRFLMDLGAACEQRHG